MSKSHSVAQMLGGPLNDAYLSLGRRGIYLSGAAGTFTTLSGLLSGASLLMSTALVTTGVSLQVASYLGLRDIDAIDSRTLYTVAADTALVAALFLLLSGGSKASGFEDADQIKEINLERQYLPDKKGKSLLKIGYNGQFKASGVAPTQKVWNLYEALMDAKSLDKAKAVYNRAIDTLK